MLNRSSKLAGAATAAIMLAVVATTALLPSPAQAYWVGGYWRPGVVVVGPPVIYAPRPYAHWVHGHYDWRGYWIPAHWA